MPEMDGFEAAIEIRGFSDIPIIALTADVFPQTRQKAIHCGMVEMVTKPFAIGDLLNTILRFTHRL